VLRALQEAGVKIDILAGHGIGAGSAALAALDGSARVWDASGLGRTPAPAGLYGWRWPIRAAAAIGVVLLATLLTPLAVLLVGLLVYLAGFVLEMLQIQAGATLVSWFSAWLQSAFAGPNLPTTVPRAATIVLIILLAVLVIGGWRAGAGHAAGNRRVRGGWWWRVVGAPLAAEPAREWFATAIWDLIRGAAPLERPSIAILGRRYSEVLAENLGQPGFRELVLVATDLDARRDIVAALLSESHRREFLAPRVGRDRRSEVLDLAGVGRDHAIDVVLAGLTPLRVCDPYPIVFAPDSYWRGETHRACDRPGAIHRLLEEVAAAGARQAIVVSAAAPVDAPHHLRAPRLDVRGRFGESEGVAEAVALRDGLEAMSMHFDALYVIQPVHNPIGPYDVEGAYDEASDRRQNLPELVERAYEDAYRQFIEPVVGASGEQLAGARAPVHRSAGEVNRR
jgi:hypothetical protein